MRLLFPFLVEHSIELSNSFIEDWKKIIEFCKYIYKVISNLNLPIMKRYCIIILGILFSINIKSQSDDTNYCEIDSIIRIEMHLSAFGVESDFFPSIDVLIDFKTGSSYCKRSYYNPKYKMSSYTLSKEEMQKIQSLLNIKRLGQLKANYTRQVIDQPKSVARIYTTKKEFIFSDYGLIGTFPLSELYKVVYKFEKLE